MTARRLSSIDTLRGAVMILMALDHVRDYVHFQIDPTDMTVTTPALFMTRWITHFCAPVFMLLAGVGASLQLARGKSKRELTWFLMTRGLWLVILEVTVIRCFGWLFNFDYHLVVLIVIWALGVSMIALAGLQWLPRPLLLVVSLVAIAGHDALNGYTATSWVWSMLHEPNAVFLPGGVVLVFGYVLIPWVFVMSLGFAIGPIFTWPEERRRPVLLAAGAAACALFVGLRVLGKYGDMSPWDRSHVLDFFNCSKYPPSLEYLLMTLGPALIALALLERWQGRLQRAIEVFGRVPLFYYLLHIPLVHVIAVVLALITLGHAGFLFVNPPAGPGSANPPEFGFSLWTVYIVWIGVVLALYLPCRWYERYKRTHQRWWLSYI